MAVSKCLMVVILALAHVACLAGLAFAVALPAHDQTAHSVPSTHWSRGQKAADVREAENKWHWISSAQSMLTKKLQDPVERIEAQAKNVVFFLGDGMSVSTVTAARILKGQQAESRLGGEEAELHMDTFPHLGTSKTFCSDAQTADSACSATAFLRGSKGNIGTIGVTPNVPYNGDCKLQHEPINQVTSALEWAQKAGKATGVVTTTRITHATPAGAYAYTANRDWESDAAIAASGQDPNVCDDIARQLILRDPGRNIDVILGGGRREFIPNDQDDPEDSTPGRRIDGVNLIEEWKNANPEPRNKFVWLKDDLLAIDTQNVDKLLGLFEYSDLGYFDQQEAQRDPSLEDMTRIAVEILSRNPNGFFLLVEGGRIDHAHHDTRAMRALVETLEFDKAIKRADDMTADEETLILVTADHAHVMSISGYPERGNDILGIADTIPLPFGDGLPYSTLSYANGPGHKWNTAENTRYNISDDPFGTPTNRYIATVPLGSETHGGDDVLILSKGPFSHLLTGVQYQSYIPHVIGYAACIGDWQKYDGCSANIQKPKNAREATTKLNKAPTNSAAATRMDSTQALPAPQAREEDSMHPFHQLRGHKAGGAIREVEDKEHWISNAQAMLSKKLQDPIQHIEAVAKNVVFFLGDGMSVGTVTGARILKGQQEGLMYGGEEAELHMDTFPSLATSKTFCSDAQTADSACSATAFLRGSKGNIGTIGVTPSVLFDGDCRMQHDALNQVTSALEWAQKAGKSTGVVTTTRITHATPAGAYAYIASREWESDAGIVASGQDPEVCDDIAEQLILRDPGRNIDVILGGGRSYFTPSTEIDPEYPAARGNRLDGKNLIEDWKNSNPEPAGRYVAFKEDLLAVDTNSVDKLLGLFEPSDLGYFDQQEAQRDPSLEDMTRIAIEILSKNPKGFFLLVEGGRIDHAHHMTEGKRALVETLEFDKAIQRADNMTTDEDTLILVTADHAHTMTISGYPQRGTDILGYDEEDQVGSDGLPYSTIGYANGPGYKPNPTPTTRYDISDDPFGTDTYKYMATVYQFQETHGGDDVLIFSKGPFSHLLSGVQQQSYIPHVIGYAACIGASDWQKYEGCPKEDPTTTTTTAATTTTQATPTTTAGGAATGFNGGLALILMCASAVLAVFSSIRS